MLMRFLHCLNMQAARKQCTPNLMLLASLLRPPGWGSHQGCIMRCWGPQQSRCLWRVAREEKSEKEGAGFFSGDS